MKNFLFFALTSALALVSLNSCKKDDVVPVAAVSLSENEVTLDIGGTFPLTVVVTPLNATNREITWSSSNESVATVDQSGRVTAIALGTATIRVTTAEGNKMDQCTVTVPPPALQGISLNKTTTTIIAGETETLIPTFTPENTEEKAIRWSSDNESVATVDQTGKVTAISPGTADIRVTGTYGKWARCIVKVEAPPVASITLSKETLTFSAVSPASLSRETLTATILPVGATDKKVIWSSSDETVATVDATGRVTALTAGTATITATAANGTKGECSVTVNPITSVTFDQTAIKLIPGETKTVMASYTPADAKFPTFRGVLVDYLQWDIKESSPGRAELTLVGIKDNYDPFRINLKSYLGIESTCNVTIESTEPMTTFSVDQSSYTVPLNGKLVITGTYSPANAKITTFAPDWVVISSASFFSPRNGVWQITLNKVTQSGTVTVKCNGSFEASCTVTVTEPEPAGVTIAGVEWATQNVGTAGKFVAKPEDYGGLFTFEEAQTACPAGWRVPTLAELQSLDTYGHIWTTVNGVNGHQFGSYQVGGDNSIFLPASGRISVSGTTVSYRNSDGNYWSSTPHESTPNSSYALLYVNHSDMQITADNNANRFSVRCVKN